MEAVAAKAERSVKGSGQGRGREGVAKNTSHDTADTHSHLVRPADVEWKKTRFPGCEVKPLLVDKESGVVTALMRFAPGAVLPDHEHVRIEQTYVIEGKLVDKEGAATGLSVGPGEFVWREAGSRHVAWTPRGRPDARHVPGAEQVLRARRPRHRHFRRRLGEPLGRRRRGLIPNGCKL